MPSLAAKSPFSWLKTCSAKYQAALSGRSGWKVTVQPLLPEAISDLVNQLGQVFRHAAPIKFTVHMVCALTSRS